MKSPSVILTSLLLSLLATADPLTWKPLFNHPGEWTQLVVTAIVDDLTVSLNGVTVTELLGDTKCLKEGHLALQLHGGQDMHVQFKDLAIFELP